MEEIYRIKELGAERTGWGWVSGRKGHACLPRSQIRTYSACVVEASYILPVSYERFS